MNFSKRNIIIGIIVLILAVAIPVTVRLAQQQQQLKSKAAATNEVKFVGPNVSGEGCTALTGDCVATDRNIQIQLTTPFPP